MTPVTSRAQNKGIQKQPKSHTAQRGGGWGVGWGHKTVPSPFPALKPTSSNEMHAILPKHEEICAGPRFTREQWQSAGLLEDKISLGRSENKGWMNEEVDVRAYLPSFTSAFSVNNTFCPLISLWITWWAWRCANPCVKKKRGRRGHSEFGSWLSSRLPIPSTPKSCSTASRAPAELLGAMGAAGAW